MAKFKVVIERPVCVSCGSCIEACPDYWEMADDGFAHLKGSIPSGDNEELEMDDLGCNKDAAEGCPVNCIYVYEDGEKII